MILFQHLHIESHPSHLSVRDHDTASIYPHSIPSYSPICQRPLYCFNISTFNPILHTCLSHTMMLLQYLHIQSHPSHLSVRDQDTASISPQSIPSFTSICQRPWYCFNISTFNPTLHTYPSKTRILFHYLHIQSHPSHLSFRDHDTASISPQSIPPNTPICQSPGFCFNISTFSPILNTYLSATRILLQYLHIQSHPTHLSVRDQKTGSTSPHSIPHYAPVSSVKSKYCLRIQSPTTLLWVLDHDTVSISPHLIPSFTPICQRPWYCFNISTFNPVLHTYLSETRILLQYLHI